MILKLKTGEEIDATIMAKSFNTAVIRVNTPTPSFKLISKYALEDPSQLKFKFDQCESQIESE